jgi:hypothetical protein
MVIFVDFQHVGLRFLRELVWRRGVGALLGG